MNRRKFICLSSLTTISLPLLSMKRVLEMEKINQPLPAWKSFYQLFQNPANQYRPFVRWWWNGDRLTQKEILRELDVMQAAGIGGVEINPIKFPEQTDDLGIPSLPWLSEEWIDMLQIALTGAKERGITCDMIVGSGWPFGGEFLTREEQTQMVALGTVNLKGSQKHQLTQKELLAAVEPPIHSPYHNKIKELISLKLVPVRLQKVEEAVDLKDQLQQERLTITVPAGDHVLYYLVKLTGYMAVIQGAPGANGPVLNHYNKAAVERYLNRMSDKLTQKIGPLGKYVRAFFTDSIELEGANWNDDFYDEFRRRNGYDLAPYFPFILFKVGHMGDALKEEYGAKFSPELQEKVNRVRFDFETTRAELFKERFIFTFTDWCKKNGVKSRMQAYGRECHPLESSMLIDIPECETWMGSRPGEVFSDEDYRGGRAYTMINKFVSSGARLAGKRLISCEEITNVGEVFNATLEQIKVAGDQSNLSGVTHSILHGFNYSPLEAPFPGWVRYGTFFNEKNPWWPYFRQWSDYKARLSAVFQNAGLFSDIAILHPIADLWMTQGPQRDPFPAFAFPKYQHQIWEAIHQNGNGADYITEAILEKATSKNGQLSFGRRSYKALLLIEVESMLPSTAEALKKFAAVGGKIIFVGKEPRKSPRLSEAAANDRTVADVIKGLGVHNAQNIGSVAPPQKNFIHWYRQIQQRFDIKPYITISQSDPFFSQLYYRAGNLDIFFFTHYGLLKSHQVDISYDRNGKSPWLWNPETGERWLYPVTGKNNVLMLDFGPAESKLLVFDRKTKGKKYLPVQINQAEGQEITKPWQVILQSVDGNTREISLDKLTDFKSREDLRGFAGVIQYNTTVPVKSTVKGTYLDLGKVNGVSELWVNGRTLGNRWYGRHRYDISHALQKGENQIQIKVTTTLGNYLKTQKDNPVAQTWTANQPWNSLGLEGPVKIINISNI